MEIDIEEMLERMVPTVYPYAHSHFLPSYGATGGNACLLYTSDAADE